MIRQCYFDSAAVHPPTWPGLVTCAADDPSVSQSVDLEPRATMSEETFQHHFKTKLLKETSSFCIESLLSNKPADRKHPARAASPPPQNGEKNIPGKIFYVDQKYFYSPGPPSFPPMLAGFCPPPPLVAPPPLEQLLKQEVLAAPPSCAPPPDLYPPHPHHALPLEILARSGLFYQNFPNFAGLSNK